MKGNALQEFNAIRRFNRTSRQLLERALTRTQRDFRHKEFDPAHLLLGVLLRPYYESKATQIIQSLGIDVKEATSILKNAFTESGGTVRNVNYTPACVGMMYRVEEVALRRHPRQPIIDEFDLMAALVLANSPVVNDILQSAGVSKQLVLAKLNIQEAR